MFHGTAAHRDWLGSGADPAYASGFDVIVVAGAANRVLAIEVDEPCDTIELQELDVVLRPNPPEQAPRWPRPQGAC